ncbi:MAG: SPOR domain-containing protein [Pseudomonadota bacterium]
MRLTYVIAAAMIAASGVGSWTLAKTLSEGATPANFPPEGFAGRSFVDNDGCIYIRAGVDGNTQWVPRVTRNRQIICGQTPTFSGRQAAVTQPRTVPLAPDVVQIAPRPTAQAQQQPQAAPRTSVETATTGAATATGGGLAAAAQRVAQAILPSQRTAQPTVVPAQTTQTVRTGTAPQVIITPQIGARQQSATQTVRVAQTTVPQTRVIQSVQAPQAASNTPLVVIAPQPRTVATPQRMVTIAPSVPTVAPGTGQRVVRQVVRGAAAGVPPVPNGYQPVWDDGRLNPNRGDPTRRVNAANLPDVVASSGTPRVLYDRRTGVMIGRAGIFGGASRALSPTVGSKSPELTVTSVQRTSAAVAAAPTPRAVSGRYVQVGAFGAPGAAERVARSFQSAGLPAALRQSGALKVVLLGPFGDQASLSRALGQARSAGFRDAYTR